MKNIYLICLIIFITISNAFSQDFVGDRGDMKSLIKAAEKFAVYYKEGKTDKWINNFDENSIVITGLKGLKFYAKLYKEKENIADIFERIDKSKFDNQKQGIEAIKKYWLKLGGLKILNFKMDTKILHIDGNRAFDYSKFRMTLKKKSGKPAGIIGRIITLWKKTGNSWKIEKQLIERRN